MKSLEKLTREVKEFFADSSGPFRPFAMFNDRLNRIYVLVRNCSVMEDRVNEVLTICEDMYPDGEQKYVGFAIEGARRFCVKHNLPSRAKSHWRQYWMPLPRNFQTLRTQ